MTGYFMMFLNWINCPGEQLPEATLYFRLQFAGVPLLMFYNGKKGKTLESSQYYTDGRYYQTSDLYSQKIYSVMDFSKFVSGVYMKSGVSPASVYTTGLMKDIKSKKVKEDTVYEFNLNHESEDGITFLSSIVGPYESFGGNFNEAEIKVNSFIGKTYVNSEGYYYKTELNLLCL